VTCRWLRLIHPVKVEPVGRRRPRIHTFRSSGVGRRAQPLSLSGECECARSDADADTRAFETLYRSFLDAGT
jgi:hypothetical protein